MMKRPVLVKVVLFDVHCPYSSFAACTLCDESLVGVDMEH